MELFGMFFGMIFWVAAIVWWIAQCRKGKVSGQAVTVGSTFVFGLPFLMMLSMAHWMFVSEPLYSAACEGDTERVRTLIAWGASPSMKFEGLPALECAARSGNLEVVRVLLDHGANIEAQNEFDGHTALDSAKENGHQAVINLLREKGARE